MFIHGIVLVDLGRSVFEDNQKGGYRVGCERCTRSLALCGALENALRKMLFGFRLSVCCVWPTNGTKRNFRVGKGLKKEKRSRNRALGRCTVQPMGLDFSSFFEV